MSGDLWHKDGLEEAKSVMAWFIYQFLAIEKQFLQHRACVS